MDTKLGIPVEYRVGYLNMKFIADNSSPKVTRDGESRGTPCHKVATRVFHFFISKGTYSIDIALRTLVTIFILLVMNQLQTTTDTFIQARTCQWHSGQHDVDHLCV